MKAWETARLEFLKHLKMRGNIPTVKEALGEHEHNQLKLRLRWKQFPFRLCSAADGRSLVPGSSVNQYCYSSLSLVVVSILWRKLKEVNISLHPTRFPSPAVISALVT